MPPAAVLPERLPALLQIVGDALVAELNQLLSFGGREVSEFRQAVDIAVPLRDPVIPRQDTACDGSLVMSPEPPIVNRFIKLDFAVPTAKSLA